VSTDKFWLAFQRLEVDASNLQGNNLRGRFNARYSEQSGLAFVNVTTTGPSLRVQLYDNAYYYIGQGAGYPAPGNDIGELFADGAPAMTLSPSGGTQDVSYVTDSPGSGARHTTSSSGRWHSDTQQ